MEFKPEGAPRSDPSFLRSTCGSIKRRSNDDQLVYLYLGEKEQPAYCRLHIRDSNIVKINKENI